MNNSELDIMFLHVIRLSSVRSRLWTAIKENPFNELVSPTHMCLWDSLDRFRSIKLGEVVPRPVLESDVPSRLAAMPTGVTALSKLPDTMNFYYDTPDDQLSEGIGMKYAQDLIMDVAREKMRDRIVDMCSQADVDALINEARGLTVTEDLKDSLVEPFSDVSKFLTTEPKEISGMEPMDIISGGGLTTGTVTGLLGPTGGGKTMTTYQIATGQARRRKHIQIMTYEQSAKGDVTHRLCSGIMEVDIERTRRPFDEWEDDLKTRYASLQPLGQYVHIKDMTLPGQGTRGMEDIRTTYNTLIERDQKPTYIILDWFLPMIKRYLVFNQIPLTGENVRSMAYDFLDQAGQFARETGTILVVNHQLDTATSRASPKRKPVVTDAMEIKAFSFNIDACYLLGNRDKETNITWFLSDKDRRGAPSELLVIMNGARARFEQAHGYLADHKGRFVKEDEVMPDLESTRRPSMSAGYL